jgi:hypothetical protein
LTDSKLQDAQQRIKYLAFITRFQSLNNQRDDIIHRLWGGGMQPGTLGAPDNASTTDAALHRHRDESMKTKSTDFRKNIRWRLDFVGLRRIATNMSQLNSDIFASFLPPGTPPGMHDVFAFFAPSGKLEAVVAPRTQESGEETSK